MSHIRFWAVQILVCSIPVLGFYQYAVSITKNIGKLEREDNKLKSLLEEDQKILKSMNKLHDREKSSRNEMMDGISRGAGSFRPAISHTDLPAHTGEEMKFSKRRGKRKNKKIQAGLLDGYDEEEGGVYDGFYTQNTQINSIESDADFDRDLDPIDMQLNSTLISTKRQKLQDEINAHAIRAKSLRKRVGRDYRLPSKNENSTQNNQVMLTSDKKATAIQPFKARKIQTAYILSCLMKAFLEVLFIHWGYNLQYLQSRKIPFLDCFTVPEKYLCLHGMENENNPDLSPCAQQGEVSCWVSRPKEKQFFLRYMLGCQFVSICVSVIDGVSSFWKMIMLCRKVRLEENRRKKKGLSNVGVKVPIDQVFE